MRGKWKIKMENFVHFYGTWEQVERQFISLTIINFAKNSIAFLLQEIVEEVEFPLKRSIWVETINMADKLDKKNRNLSEFFTYKSNVYLNIFYRMSIDIDVL